MTNLPPGNWNLDEYEDFSDWVTEIRSLPGNSTLRDIVIMLKAFSAQLAAIFEPIPSDQEDDEDEEDEEDPDAQGDEDWSPAVTGEVGGTIHVKSRGRGKAPAAIQDDVLLEVYPKVRSLVRPSSKPSAYLTCSVIIAKNSNVPVSGRLKTKDSDAPNA